jgi:monoamine oxidase
MAERDKFPTRWRRNSGERIRLGEPVVRLNYDSAAYTVETTQNTFTAKFAIHCHAAPSLPAALFIIPLPPQREQLTQRVPMGCLR